MGLSCTSVSTVLNTAPIAASSSHNRLHTHNLHPPHQHTPVTLLVTSGTNNHTAFDGVHAAEGCYLLSSFALPGMRKLVSSHTPTHTHTYNHHQHTYLSITQYHTTMPCRVYAVDMRDSTGGTTATRRQLTSILHCIGTTCF